MFTDEYLELFQPNLFCTYSFLCIISDSLEYLFLAMTRLKSGMYMLVYFLILIISSCWCSFQLQAKQLKRNASLKIYNQFRILLKPLNTEWQPLKYISVNPSQRYGKTTFLLLKPNWSHKSMWSYKCK